LVLARLPALQRGQAGHCACARTGAFICTPTQQAADPQPGLSAAITRGRVARGRAAQSWPRRGRAHECRGGVARPVHGLVPVFAPPAGGIRLGATQCVVGPPRPLPLAELGLREELLRRTKIGSHLQKNCRALSKQGTLHAAACARRARAGRLLTPTDYSLAGRFFLGADGRSTSGQQPRPSPVGTHPQRRTHIHVGPPCDFPFRCQRAFVDARACAPSPRPRH
jgi:hypothetical protein